MSTYGYLIKNAVDEFSTLSEKYGLKSRLKYVHYNLCLCTKEQLCTDKCIKIIQSRNNQRVLGSVQGMIDLIKIENEV